jgi:hypothetical protein
MEERELLMRTVFAYTKVSGALARIPLLSEVDEEGFGRFLEAFPLST